MTFVIRTFRIFMCLAVILCSHYLPAQHSGLVTAEYNCRRYTIADGLPTESISCIFQDSRGFIWIGCEQGFARYDGFTFKTYLADKSIPINKIEENSTGEIIAYGYQFIYGLNFATDSLRLITSTDRLSYNAYNSPGLPAGYSIYYKRDNNTLGIYRLRNDSLEHVFSHPRLNDISDLGSVYWDSSKQLFYIAGENQVYEVNEDGEEKATHTNIGISRFVVQNKELFGIGPTGIWQKTKTGFERIYTFTKKLEDDVSAIAAPDHSLIIRDYKHVIRYRNGKLETLIDEINIVSGLLIDNESNLWMTSQQGLYNFYKTDFITYKVNQKQADVVRSLVPADDKTVYMATMEGKIIRLGDGICEDLKYKPSGNASVASFTYGSIRMGNAYYFSAFGDFLKYSNGKFKWMNIPAPYYTYSCKVNDNRFIIGCMGFLLICDREGNVIRKVEHKTIGRPSIYTAQMDDHDRLWIGGHKGICIIGAKDSIYLFNDNTKNCGVSAKDKRGRIWLGCENRIYRSVGDTIELVTSFPGTVVNNMCFTKGGMLLVSTNSNIVIIDPETMRLVSYSYVNGFTSGEPGWNTMVEDSDGNIWLPTGGSNVAKFNPTELIGNQTKPLLYVMTTKYSSDNINWESASTDNISLKHSQNNIRLSYIGLCYSAPQNVRYRYNLKGFQDEWSQPVNEREITFNNLPPGNYEFHLKADAGTVDTETTVLSIPFVIHPAFWQTWWFISLCVITLILTSAGIALYVQYRRNRKLVQRLETERELNDLRIRSIRLRGIPHFNANVLSAIEYYIMNMSKDEASRLLGIYAEFTGQTLREMDKASRSLREELDYTKLYLQLEKLRFVNKFNYEVNIDPEIDPEIQLPNMVLHTYCENAIKHGFATRASGCVLKISVKKKDDAVEVCVEDNGVGREAASKNSNIRSTKQGLNILNRQIEIYNSFNKQKIVKRIVDIYTNNVPSGTRFIIEIPNEFSYE